MKTICFKKLVKTNMEERVFSGLTLRQKLGEKGKTIKYTKLCIGNCLLPEAGDAKRSKFATH